MTQKLIFFAFSTKRIRVSMNISESLKNYRNIETKILYDPKKISKHYWLGSPSDHNALIPVEQSFFSPNTKKTKSMISKIFASTTLERLLQRVNQVYLFKLVKGFIELFENQKEELFINLVEAKANSILQVLLKNGACNDLSNVIMVLEGDRTVDFELPSLLLKTRFSQLSLILLEIADCASKKELLKHKRFNKFNSTTSYRRKYHSLIKNTSEAGKLFYKFYECVALKKLDILSPNPWIMGSSPLVNDVFLKFSRTSQSETSQNSYHATVRYNNFINEYTTLTDNLNFTDIQPYDNFVLFAVPQFYEDGVELSFFGKRRIKNDLYKIVKNLSCSGESIVLSLHPKQYRGNYEYLVINDKVMISHEDVHKLILKCKYLVSTESSVLDIAWQNSVSCLIWIPKYWKSYNIISQAISTREWSRIFSRSQDISKLSIDSFILGTQSYYSTLDYKSKISNLNKLDSLKDLSTLLLRT